ncbi:MAG TPA: hypothetical protein VE978_26285 [Chitinophagales bacterium]|nr:hypothetical protein [Chitinophagales bacterium]
MTKKEKKELALQLKAEIDAKKPKPENTEIISKEKLKRGNEQRYANGKAKSMRAVKMYKQPNRNHWDTAPW